MYIIVFVLFVCSSRAKFYVLYNPAVHLADQCQRYSKWLAFPGGWGGGGALLYISYVVCAALKGMVLELF